VPHSEQIVIDVACKSFNKLFFLLVRKALQVNTPFHKVYKSLGLNKFSCSNNIVLQSDSTKRNADQLNLSKATDGVQISSAYIVTI